MTFRPTEFTPHRPEPYAQISLSAINAMRDNVLRLEGQVRLLREAIRLTQEYLGPFVLPPETGWAWFDAMRATDPSEPPCCARSGAVPHDGPCHWCPKHGG
jgi:hypothetical protein